MGTQNVIFDPPTLQPMKDGTWHLAYDWTLSYRDELYHLPAGFVTDGASIPRFLWRLCGTPMDIPRLYAALVHDFLYSGGDPLATRADADALYRDLQIDLGISRIKAYTEWSALRLFGGSHWEADKEGTK